MSSAVRDESETTDPSTSMERIVGSGPHQYDAALRATRFAQALARMGDFPVSSVEVAAYGSRWHGTGVLLEVLESDAERSRAKLLPPSSSSRMGVG